MPEVTKAEIPTPSLVLTQVGYVEGRVDALYDFVFGQDPQKEEPKGASSAPGAVLQNAHINLETLGKCSRMEDRICKIHNRLKLFFEVSSKEVPKN